MREGTEKIENYLKHVRAGLRGFPAPEITEILNELRAHILERIGSAASPTAIDSALRALGRPEEIAALYLAENLTIQAESRRSPWIVLRTVFHWATFSVKGFVIFAICLIGFSLGLSFFLTAVMKPFHPQNVGLWMSNVQSNYSLHVGGYLGPSENERELLGWWIIPIGFSLGGGSILLTTQFALWALRWLRRSRHLPLRTAA